ncbi:hypothetical protein AVEN_256731-1 [Araneus ventricosus]|uniref:Uncharacterized protein n=1 Tax=Araneus ventricosus TaxID=182803 RepID=A0A4Y2FS31_ARAVE|nr:hypothetical protein AVEN_256731-1 [Araneus ventricosus]
MLLGRTHLDEIRTRLAGSVTKRGTYRGSARRFHPTWKTNVWPSYWAKAAFLNKAPVERLKVSELCGGSNGLYLEGSICDFPCLMLVVPMSLS